MLSRSILLHVLSPTPQFDYVNEYVNVDRFDIDLYTADGGTGDCGTWVASICDKDHIGCLDSSEYLPL